MAAGYRKKDYPNLKIIGYTDGYVTNKDQIMDNISKLSPDIVLVALGIPYQEKLIYNKKQIKNIKKHNNKDTFY